MAAPDDLLTVLEAAKRMRVSKMTVYRLIERGELEAAKVGRSFRVRRDDIEKMLRPLPSQPVTLIHWD